MRVAYQKFKSSFLTWQGLFDQAAEFASQIAPDRLISISHSADNGVGVVAVWYWQEEGIASGPIDES